MSMFCVLVTQMFHGNKHTNAMFFSAFSADTNKYLMLNFVYPNYKRFYLFITLILVYENIVHITLSALFLKSFKCFSQIMKK